MSSNHQLQNRITGPRESTADARVAKTHETVRSTGRDGKLYNKVSTEDTGKFHVLDEEALKVEERKNSELKRAIQLTTGGSKNGRDGLAKTVTVGTASHKTKLTIATQQQSFPVAGGAESKTIETMHKGDVGVVTGAADAKGQAKESASHSSDSKNQAPAEVKISTNTHTLSPQSKAYDKNIGDITAMMKDGEREGDSTAQAKSMPAPPSRGDRTAPPPPIPNSSTTKEGTNTTKKHVVISKTEAILLHEQNLRAAAADREEFEKQQRERFHRAAVKGKSFDAMFARAEKHAAKTQAKAEYQATEARKKEREAREARDRKRKEHLAKELNPPGELSWLEMQEQQEISRRESAEKRKQELASSSQAPAAAGSAHGDQEKAMRAAAKRAEYENAHNFSFKADDPDKVSARLARQNAAWERNLEAEREKVRQRVAERLLSSAGKPSKSPLAGMENRAAEAAARRAARQAQKNDKEAAIAAKMAEVERKKKEKLFNTKTPEEGRRPTKSTALRANVVRSKFEAKINAEKKEAAEMAKKAKAEREMSHLLSHQINDWEKSRRESMPGYHELSEAELEQNRREARANYKANMKRNQDRLKEVLSERPSLLERHEQTMTSKSAATQALSKVAAAVHGDRKGARDSYDNDDFDFFNEEEKVKLSVTK